MPKFQKNKKTQFEENKKRMPEKFDPLIITDKKNIYYGGDQGWFSSNTKACAGCGAIACVNMLRMLAYRFPEMFNNRSNDMYLLTLDKYNKDDFIRLMEKIYGSMFVYEVPILRKIYDHVKRNNIFFHKIPANFGITMRGFTAGTLKFCYNNGIYLHAHVFPTTFCSYTDARDFIRKGINESGCVVLFTSMSRHPLKLHRNGSESDLKNGIKAHFMTITEFNDNIVKLSTWGYLATVDYDDLYNSWQKARNYTGALFYFTPADTQKTVKKDIINSWPIMIKAIFYSVFGR